MEREEIQRWREEKERWREETLEPFQESSPERREVFKTSSGIRIDDLYTPDNSSYREIGFPGEYPFTRGVYPTMYRGRLWTMRQYAGFATAKETNKRFHYLLSKGQTGLSTAFDLPTQLGLDSDHPLSQGEVGRVGVAIDSIKDMETLFSGIPLEKVSTSMTINAPAAVLLAMYLALAREKGVDYSKLRGTIQNDILKEYIARGTYIFPPAPSMRLITDIFQFCSQNVPLFNTISISGYHIREAGATAAQELAFTLMDGITYVEAALEAGLTVDSFAPRLSFFFNAHLNLFEEIAKFRAARRLWASLMREYFQPKKEKSMTLRFHTQTAGCTLTAQQPENNVIRVTLQALAAVLGGTQSLHTNSRDEALALPSEEAVQIALRTQQIIAHESGVCDSVDPLGGSYYLESLTDSLEEKAREYIQKIQDLGGMVRAIERGYIQQEIHESAYLYQKRMEEGEQVVVGVNRFQEEEETKIDLLRVDPQVEKEQRDHLKVLREERLPSRVEEALKRIGEAAEGEENLIPPIIEGVEARATLGEICQVLREVFGEYKGEGL